MSIQTINTLKLFCADAGNHMAFGKFYGKTYCEVLTHHPQYCRWILKIRRPYSKDVNNFQNYCRFQKELVLGLKTAKNQRKNKNVKN